MKMNRNKLVTQLGIKLETETPEERKISTRCKVDEALAKLFGAKYFFGIDWRVFGRKKTFTLEEIAYILGMNEVRIPPEELVGERLKVDRYNKSEKSGFYSFEKVVDSRGKERYRLVYH